MLNIWSLTGRFVGGGVHVVAVGADVAELVVEHASWRVARQEVGEPAPTDITSFKF